MFRQVSIRPEHAHWFACARSCRWRILGLSKVFWRKKIRALVLAEEQTENSVALSAGCRMFVKADIDINVCF
jgi:hypothetical protein